jgi:hypothetical protein
MPMVPPTALLYRVLSASAYRPHPLRNRSFAVGAQPFGYLEKTCVECATPCTPKGNEIFAGAMRAPGQM